MDESAKPEWMRQAACVPCNCGVFFCKEGESSAINHKHQKTRTEKKKLETKKSAPQRELTWDTLINAMFATTSAIMKILMSLHTFSATNHTATTRVAKASMFMFANIVGQHMNIKIKRKIIE